MLWTRYWKTYILPEKNTEQPSDALSDRLSACYSGALHDTLRELGHTNCVLPSDIKPIDPSYKLAGREFTMEGHLEPGLDGHETLLRWTEFLARAPADRVVICQSNDSTIAHMGELSAETLQFRGVRGYIVDGGNRDTEFVLAMGFPVFCRHPHAEGRGRRVGAGSFRRADRNRRGCHRQ